MSTKSQNLSSLKSTLYIGIDPSIASLGMAGWDSMGPVFMACVKQPGRTDDWQSRASNMAEVVSTLCMSYLLRYQSVDIAIECPDNWHTDRGTSSKNNEAVQKLYAVTGALTNALRLPGVVNIWTPTPKQWKGQASKEITVPRAKALVEKLPIGMDGEPTHDAWEALLLAKRSWVMGDVRLDKWPRSYSGNPIGSTIELCMYFDLGPAS